jgi:hypothetical protein
MEREQGRSLRNEDRIEVQRVNRIVKYGEENGRRGKMLTGGKERLAKKRLSGLGDRTMEKET